jgi:hypothetical protein
VDGDRSGVLGLFNLRRDEKETFLNAQKKSIGSIQWRRSLLKLDDSNLESSVRLDEDEYDNISESWR